MGDLSANFVSLRDAAWLKIRVAARICADSTTAQQVQMYLEKGETITALAATSSDIVGGNTSISTQLRKASESLGKIRFELSKTRGACQDIKAAGEIANALAILTEWKDGKRTPAEAARAFDQLFGGAARFAEKLPSPLKQYALILKQISISNFFSNMQNLMDPEGDTPRGRELRRVMRELEEQDSGGPSLRSLP